jgi:hypothetical protein
MGSVVPDNLFWPRKKYIFLEFVNILIIKNKWKFNDEQKVKEKFHKEVVFLFYV